MGSIGLYCVWSLHDMAYTEVSKLSKVLTTKYCVVLASQVRGCAGSYLAFMKVCHSAFCESLESFII